MRGCVPPVSRALSSPAIGGHDEPRYFGPENSPDPTAPIKAIAYGGNQFLLVGVQTIGSSWDGTLWSAGPTITTTLHGVAYGNARFVAVGNEKRTLPNGGSWKNITSQVVSGITQWLRGIAYGPVGGGLFVAVGDDGRILTTPDGAGWKSRSSGTFDHLRAIAYGNDTFVAVGDKGTVLTSSDGRTWTKVTSANVAGDFRAIAYGNGTFVAVQGTT